MEILSTRQPKAKKNIITKPIIAILLAAAPGFGAFGKAAWEHFYPPHEIIAAKAQTAIEASKETQKITELIFKEIQPRIAAIVEQNLSLKDSLEQERNMRRRLEDRVFRLENRLWNSNPENDIPNEPRPIAAVGRPLRTSVFDENTNINEPEILKEPIKGYDSLQKQAQIEILK